MTDSIHYDVLIIGSGIAGLSLALQLASFAKIGLISKVELFNSSSQYAQGGIAAVTDSKDFSSHINDTLIAGAGLCDESTVAFTVEQAPKAIAWLIEQGVEFTKDPKNPASFHLTREGGHSHRRIYHVADSTGAAIIKTLTQKVIAHRNIHCLLNHAAIKLLVKDNRCYGAEIYNRQTQQIEALFSRSTVLATGGASNVYFHTSNPSTSTGDGLAMAWQAGCRIANLEFNQFHPTSLYHPEAHSFLISEAVRGEGGILCLPNGQRFMEAYDSRKELAPRDIVARAITFEMKRNQLDYVLLDISHKPAHELLQLFPMITAKCQKFGFDLTKQGIPVVPAAHYTCGGIMTDHDAQTDVEQLYAIGEAACTGLHGANRMASNSLLECIVFSTSASHAIQHHLNQSASPLPSFNNAKLQIFPKASKTFKANDQALYAKILQLDSLTLALRQSMSQHLGVIRSNQQLCQVKQEVTTLFKQLNDCFPFDSAEPAQSPKKSITYPEAFYALQNRFIVSQLMILSASSRLESRGCHYNHDYPDEMSEAKPTILIPNEVLT